MSQLGQLLCLQRDNTLRRHLVTQQLLHRLRSLNVAELIRARAVGVFLSVVDTWTL